MRIFISYAEPEGVPLALQAEAVSEGVGHEVWLWVRDRSPGARTWSEIALKIVQADRFVYICTRSSEGSFGQTEEYNLALNAKKEVIAFRVDGALLPEALRGRNYEPVSTDNFRDACERVAAALGDLQAAPQGGETTTASPEVVQARQVYIAELRERTNGLRKDRVAECVDEMLASYEAGTIPRRLSNLSQVFDRTPSGFLHIGIWLRTKLEKFNASNYIWGPFARDLGHRVALAEQKYLYETITASTEPSDRWISTSDPDLSILPEEINAVRAAGHVPNILLAPIDLMIPFYHYFRAQLTWEAHPGEILTLPPGIRLQVFWSNGAAPLDRFVILNCQAGIWKVKPDPETGHALTAAIGESRLYRDEVEWVAETTVKYEVTDLNAFRAVPVEGEGRRYG